MSQDATRTVVDYRIFLIGILIVFATFATCSISRAASYTVGLAPDYGVSAGSYKKFSVSSGSGVPSNASVTQVIVWTKIRTYSTSVTAGAAARFYKDNYVSSGETLFQAGDLSGTGYLEHTETFSSEFDDIDADRTWYFNFFNNASAAYIIKEVEVTVYYDTSLPDLVIQNKDVSPSTIEAGGQIHLTYRVKNQGEANAGSSRVRSYLSSNSTYGSSDDYLGGMSTTSLSAGSYENDGIYADIPDDVSAGSWYVLFVADADDEVDESDESNNVAYESITVTEKKKPNLVPYRPSGWDGEIVVSKEAGTNDSDSTFTTQDHIYIDYAYKNVGEASTDRTFYSKLYIDGVSKDTETEYSPFTAGEYNTVEDVPGIKSLPAGTHEIKLVVDDFEYIDETSESDNSTSVWITVNDYNPAIYNVRPTTGTYRIGDTITVQWDTTDIPSDAEMKVSLKQDSYEEPEENEKYAVLTRQDGVDDPTPNDGTQSFAIPSHIETAGDWQVWVGVYDNSAASTRCDGHISIEPCEDPLEPNDDFSQAFFIDGMSYSNDQLCIEPDTYDWFRFLYNLKSYYFKVKSRTSGPYGIRFDLVGDNLTIETVSVNSIPVDTLLYLYDSDHSTELALDDNGGEGNFSKIVQVVDLNCYFTDLDPERWSYKAINFLCEEEILDGYPDGTIRPTEDINRAELAKVTYLAAFGGDVPSISDYFPTRFYDLQDETDYYYRYAKALSYLEFRDGDDLDGVSPFDRDKSSFFPEKPIAKKFVLKVLLEAFDIEPDESGPSPYLDVSVNNPWYGYVKAAADLNIIDDDKDYFEPDENCNREDAFQMLANMLDGNPEVRRPDISQEIDPATADFHIPENITPANFGRILGLAEGHFNFTSKTSFAIPGRKIPLMFSHAYNSQLTALPDIFLPIQPLGAGWTHNYNAYIQRIEIWDEDQKALDFRWVAVRPGGALNSYKRVGADYTCETQGVYDELTRPDSTQFVLKTKNQTVYTFDKVGVVETFYMLSSVEDRNGNSLSLSYVVANDLPRLEEVQGPAGRKLTFHYHDGTNLLESVVDPIDRTVRFSYTDGLLTGFTDAENLQTVYNYFSTVGKRNLLSTILLPKGNVISNDYEQRKLKSTQLNNQSPVNVEFDPDYASGAYQTVVKTFRDGSPQVAVHRSFDMDGKISEYQVRDKNDAAVPGASTQFRYDDPDNETMPTRIEKNGVVVQFQYDDNGNLLHTEKTAGGETISQSFTYSALNDVKTYQDPRGNVTTFNYQDGNLTGIVDPLGHETVIGYNEHGQPTSVVNPSGVQVAYDYDAHGNLDWISMPVLNIEADMEYDAASRMFKAFDFERRETRWQYDDNDNMLQVSRIAAHEGQDVTTGFTYDANENLTAIENAKNIETTMDYYEDSDLLKFVEFEGAQKTYVYYDDGALKTFTDPAGQVFTYQYDDQGMLSSDGYADYGYDDKGRLETVSKDGKTIQFFYDSFHRISAVSYEDISNTVSYQYDDAGNIEQIVYPGDKTVSYGYDANNRMKTVQDWNGNITRYEYRPDGQLDKTIYPNGVVCQYGYDSAGRMNSMHTARDNGTGSVIASYAFTMDNLGNHTRETILEPFPGYPDLASENVTYTYDNANRIQSAGDTQFTFDPNGNTETKDGKTFVYDKINNLTSVSDDFNALTYTYDGLGHRRSRTADGQTTHYVLDLLGMSKVLMETDAQGSPIHYYVYGLGLISRVDPDEDTRYYCYDYRGSTVAMVDGSADALVTHRYRYDAFGAVIDADPEEEDFNPFRYVGRFGVMYESDDLYFMRARYYDPEIGRFLSEDPIWASNLYPYANNLPVMLIDPLGLEWTKTKLVLLGAGKIIGGVGLFALSAIYAPMTLPATVQVSALLIANGIADIGTASVKDAPPEPICLTPPGVAETISILTHQDKEVMERAKYVDYASQGGMIVCPEMIHQYSEIKHEESFIPSKSHRPYHRRKQSLGNSDEHDSSFRIFEERIDGITYKTTTPSF